MNNSNLKTQVKSVLGRNGFPGSPLFCQYGEHYGLVGVLLNQKGSSTGNKLTIEKKNTVELPLQAADTIQKLHFLPANCHIKMIFSMKPCH